MSKRNLELQQMLAKRDMATHKVNDPLAPHLCGC